MRTMSNSWRLRASRVTRARLSKTNIFAGERAQSMRNTARGQARIARGSDAESRSGRRISPDQRLRAESRMSRGNFRFGIFGSIRNPFSSRCRHAAFDERASILRVHSLPIAQYRPVTLVRTLVHPSHPILLLALKCDRDIHGRNRRDAEQSRAEGAEWKETDFQMDINSSACSIPRSSLITPLQLLSLIKASGPADA